MGKKQLKDIHVGLSSLPRTAYKANMLQIMEERRVQSMRAKGLLPEEPNTIYSPQVKQLQYEQSARLAVEAIKTFESALQNTMSNMLNSLASAFNTAKMQKFQVIFPNELEQRKLEQEIIEQEKGIPDYVQCLIGWRSWKVQEDDTYNMLLKAIDKNHCWELRQPIRAECAYAHRGQITIPHKAPGYHCSCGIWSFKRPDILLEALVGYRDIQVYGTVANWGRVIETENGYRSEYSYPTHLFVTSREFLPLGDIYSVPIEYIGINDGIENILIKDLRKLPVEYIRQMYFYEHRSAISDHLNVLYCKLNCKQSKENNCEHNR